MYIVDMHRGMIGHHAYLSPYLKKKTAVSRMDTLVNFGRILKVKSSANKTEAIPDFEALNSSELVALLKHKNGWVRDRAQNFLIFKESKDAVSQLKELALNGDSKWTRIYALHTLNGLDALDFNFLTAVADGNESDVTAHAIVLLEQFISKENSTKAAFLFEELIAKNDATIDLYLSSSLGKWISIDNSFFRLLMPVFNKHKGSTIFEEAVLSGLDGQESYFSETLVTMSSFDEPNFMSQLATTIENKTTETVNPIYSRKSLNEDNRTAGAKMFYQICASCHGGNGEGIEGLAPPLMKSEHVADARRLGLIILHGLQGPVTVKGTAYNFNLAMPGLIRNESISDKDIADVMSYVTNAFSDMPKFLSAEKVSELRKLIPKSGAEYTEEELLEYSKKHSPVSPGFKLN
jgi:mono/diheme cytochrome c family protein